jgi:CRP/FNR family transcriptional regulator, anaerobic regulatory protein
MSRRRSSAFKVNTLWSVLPKEQLSRLNRITYTRRYIAGQFIVGAGQQQEWFATILSGVVKLTKSIADGRRQIVGLLFASDFLGRPFGSGSPCTAEATTAVELGCVDRRFFEDLMLETVEMKQLLLERTLDEMDAAREWMLLLGQKTAQEKVATLLLLVAQRMHLLEACIVERRKTLCYELPLSRMEMAEFLCLRVETVSRELRRLKSAGVIDVDKRRYITLQDIGKLGRIVGKEAG